MTLQSPVHRAALTGAFLATLALAGTPSVTRAQEVDPTPATRAAGRGPVRSELDTDPSPGCVEPESDQIRRIRRTRDVSWGVVGAGTLVLATSFAGDIDTLRWSRTAGAGGILLMSGLVPAVFAGSMLRRRCRTDDAFALRFGRRSRIAGIGLLVAGAGLAAAGTAVLIREPHDDGQDGDIYSAMVSLYGLYLPALIAGAAGTGLMVMSRRRRGRGRSRVMARLGPGTFHLHYTW